MKKSSLLLFSLSLIFMGEALASVQFYYYGQDTRVAALEDLYRTVKGRYSLWEIKNINMNIDGDKLFKNALLIEKSIEDVEGPLNKATANILFHGRVKQLIASFQDTHFSGSENSPLPTITNGIRFSPIFEDEMIKAIVTAKSKKIMEFNKKDISHGDIDKISVGDEVIAIDGVLTSEVLKNINSYVAGSSPGFVTSRGIRNLGQRNFNYPDKNYSEWTFKTIKNKTYKVRLPWYVDKIQRKDAAVFFNSKKYRQLNEVHFSWDAQKMTWTESEKLEYEGFNRFYAPKGLLNIKSYYGSSSVVMRTGYFIQKGKSFGYVQLFSFTNDKLTDRKDEGGALLTVHFRNFIKELKENNTPLIFDLRLNFGGNSTLALENLSTIAREGDVYPSRTLAYRTTQYMQQIFNTWNYDPSVAEYQIFQAEDEVLNEFTHAVSINRKYTNLILQAEPITAHEDVGGYELPIVAMISPWCISACDNQAFLLEASNRVTLIGEPANGTGAGFNGNQFHSPTYIDPFFIIKARIPNYLFGYPVVSDQRVLADPDSSLLMQTNSENRPVVPAIEFRYTRETYKNNSQDWINKAIETINMDLNTNSVL